MKKKPLISTCKAASIDNHSHFKCTLHAGKVGLRYLYYEGQR